MTLCQLRYIDMIAKRGTLTVTAEALFVTQPSLTVAFRELEQELGIALFLRSRKGLSLTPAGGEFLDYARQIPDQMSLVEQRCTDEARRRHHFCVSPQRYSFAIEAFVVLLNAYGDSQYEFHIQGTETYRILEDIAKVRSEIGVLYRNQFNVTVLQRNFQEMKLSFTPVCRVKLRVFLGTQHPLIKKAGISMGDLRDYPRLSHEQGQRNSFYFSEEIRSAVESNKDIVVYDRATLFNLLIDMNGYTICSDIINTELGSKSVVARPLAVDDYIELGYVLLEEHLTSDLTLAYTDLLRQFVR